MELPGCVRLQTREEEEPLPADCHDDVLRARRLRAARLQEVAYEPLVAARLAEVLAVRGRELRVACDLRRRPQLGECLLLDRVRVGQVLRQLFCDLGHAPGLRALRPPTPMEQSRSMPSLETRSRVWRSLGIAAVLACSAGGGATASDTKRVAFIRGDGRQAVLVTAEEDGTGATALTSARDGAVIGYSWAPDGRRIAVVQCRRRDCRAYVINADGRQRRQLAANVESAVWMPDGKRILVDRRVRPGYWTVDVATGIRRRFSPPGLAAAPGSPRLSPDGRRYLHLAPPYGRRVPTPPGSAPHHTNARNWLIVTDLRSRRSRRPTRERGWYVLGAAPWSSDGTAITFTRRRTLQTTTGAVYVAEGSAGVRRLAAGAREAGAWSRDGSKIIFSNASCRIRIVTLDGRISTLPFRGCVPSWQP